MAKRTERKRERGIQELIGGLTVGGVFTFVYFSSSWAWWAIFPIIFGGILPAVQGLSKIIASRRLSIDVKNEEKRRIASREKDVLRSAQQHKGILSPSIVALDTNLSIEEADALLQQLAGKGICSMEVRESGRIEYVFEEFKGPTQLPG